MIIPHAAEPFLARYRPRVVLLETLTISLGSSLARALVKSWVGDSDLVLDVTDSVGDLLKQAGLDFRDRRRVERDLEAICERVAERLEPLFAVEYSGGLPPNEANAAALAVAETIDRGFSHPKIALDNDLDPDRLLTALRKADPTASRRAGLSPEGIKLYNVALAETCTYLIQMVSELPNFGSDVTAELLARERAILDRLEEALDRLPVSDANKALDFQTRYLRAAVAHLDIVELYGLPSSLDSSVSVGARAGRGG